MSNLKVVVEFLFSCGMFVNAVLFIPQAWKVYRYKEATGVSLATFIGFLLIQFTIVLHGVINHDWLLVFGYIICMLTCGSVVVLTIIYRK